MDLECVLTLEHLLPNAENSDEFFQHLLETIRNVFHADGCIWLQEEKIIKVGRHFSNSSDFVQIGYLKEFGLMKIINPNKHLLSSKMVQFLEIFLANITKLIHMKSEYEKNLCIDVLTGVYNRNAFNQRILSQNCFTNVGVLFGDINGLGIVNNTYGHEVGDKMIKTVADCISSHFRKEDVYRKGGDEFVVVCTGISEQMFIHRIKLVKQLIADTEYSASFGEAYSKHTQDIDYLMEIADQKMYQEKENYRLTHPSKYKVKRINKQGNV